MSFETKRKKRRGPSSIFDKPSNPAETSVRESECSFSACGRGQLVRRVLLSGSTSLTAWGASPILSATEFFLPSLSHAATEVYLVYSVLIA